MSKNKEIEVRESSALIGKEWFDSLIEDCEAIITEAVEQSRWSLVEGYHQLGTRINEEKNRFTKLGIDTDGTVQRVAQSLGKSTRTIHQAMQFAAKFPKVEEIPGGKNISWHKVCTKLLLGKDVDEKCKHNHGTMTVEICVECGKKVKDE